MLVIQFQFLTQTVWKHFAQTHNLQRLTLQELMTRTFHLLLYVTKYNRIEWDTIMVIVKRTQSHKNAYVARDR